MSKSRKPTRKSGQKQAGPRGAERRSGQDRRGGKDRRQVDIPVKVDRRKGEERRSPMDRRQCPLS